MAKYAGANPQLGIDAPYAFGGVFAVAKILNAAASSLTTPAITAAAKKFTGPVLLGPPTEQFGHCPRCADRGIDRDSVLHLRGQRQMEGRRRLDWLIGSSPCTTNQTT